MNLITTVYTTVVRMRECVHEGGINKALIRLFLAGLVSVVCMCAGDSVNVRADVVF